MCNPIKLTMIAIVLCILQTGARAESLQEWSRRFNVQHITGMATFQANPLRDKGSIIAVPVKFDRMAAENVAIFRGGVLPGPGDASPSAQIAIANAPAGQFSIGQSLVLAFKVIGMHSQYGFPEGEFVAVYSCTRTDCQDFFR